MIITATNILDSEHFFMFMVVYLCRFTHWRTETVSEVGQIAQVSDEEPDKIHF